MSRDPNSIRFYLGHDQLEFISDKNGLVVKITRKPTSTPQGDVQAIMLEQDQAEELSDWLKGHIENAAGRPDNKHVVYGNNPQFQGSTVKENTTGYDRGTSQKYNQEPLGYIGNWNSDRSGRTTHPRSKIKNDNYSLERYKNDQRRSRRNEEEDY